MYEAYGGKEVTRLHPASRVLFRVARWTKLADNFSMNTWEQSDWFVKWLELARKRNQ